MGKRLDESSKGKSIRFKKAAAAKSKTSRTTAAKELSPIEAIMTMTTKDAWKYRTLFGSARSRQSPSRGKP